MSQPSLCFLDFDDVLCLNRVYGGYDVFQPNHPADLFEKLFHPPAVEILRLIAEEHQPKFVITTSWLRFMEREGFEALFHKTGLPFVAEALHEHWEAPPDRGMTRCQAIEQWLKKHHAGEAYVVLDDTFSGTGLKGSLMDKQKRVVLCKCDVGLTSTHLSQVRRALGHAPLAPVKP